MLLEVKLIKRESSHKDIPARVHTLVKGQKEKKSLQIKRDWGAFSGKEGSVKIYKLFSLQSHQ